jgi:ADP-ribose pyrophosphatase
MLKRWIQRSSEIRFKNPWWTYKVDAFDIEGGLSGQYHYVHTEGSVIILPVTDAGRLILVKQFRYLLQSECIEFPGGSLKPDHSYEQMAQIELQEETGYRAHRLDFVGTFNPYNGVTTEMCRVYVAHDLEPVDVQPDETEEFELLECTIEELDQLIADNKIWDGMALAAWMLGRPRVLSLLGEG